MYALNAIILFVAVAYAQAGGIGFVRSIDSGVILSGPAGIVSRSGLAAPGLITAGLAPRVLITEPALGLGLGVRGLDINGLALNAPGLAAKALGLEGTGIEGQWIPDINEKLYDDGSYRPGLDH